MGRSVLRRGFWGDVASSPFAAVGRHILTQAATTCNMGCNHA